MSSIKYLVPAIALAGRAVAQSSSCSVSATTTIQSQSDATALSACSTFSGSIAIATGTTDSIALDGIKEITGSLIANNVTQITSLSAGDLETIGDEFGLNGLTILSSLSFPLLTDVGSIVWETLPALQGLSFTTGVQTTDELNIQDTQLTSLDGINLQVVDTVYITNNKYLEDIEMQLGNISTSLTIEANGNNVSLILPNLIWANNMTVRNVGVFSSPSLEAVNGSLGFYSNDFANVDCANLTTVGGSLSFIENSDLTGVSMPILKSISGAFNIQNNTDYSVVDGFEKLATIGGALTFAGNFTNVTLPSLDDVRGAFSITSTGDVSDSCSSFKSLKSSGDIQGSYKCTGTSTSSSSGSSSSSSSSTSSGSSSSSSTGAAAGMYVPVAATGFFGVVGVLFGLM